MNQRVRCPNCGRTLWRPDLISKDKDRKRPTYTCPNCGNVTYGEELLYDY